MLVDLYLQGRFDLDAFVTETIGLDDVEEAFDKMHARRGAALGGGPVSGARSRRRPRSSPRGTFSLDGGTWDVDNNVWVVGDDNECVVIDAAARRDGRSSSRRSGDRRPARSCCTHAHDDHVTASPELRRRAPARRSCCTRTTGCCGTRSTPTTPGRATSPTATSSRSAASTLHGAAHARATPPGACCFYAADLGAVFTGDTLFQGGPGATGRSYSDFPTIVESIRDQLLTLPAETVVHTGHGDATTIGAEAPHLQEWIARGH